MQLTFRRKKPRSTLPRRRRQTQPRPRLIRPSPTVTSASGTAGTLVDRHGERIGRLEDVYFDVGTDQPQFATVKEGLLGRHLTFVPLTEVTIGPDALQVSASKADVKDAPNLELQGDELSQADESTLYHYYQLNYTPSDTPSGRRLARR